MIATVDWSHEAAWPGRAEHVSSARRFVSQQLAAHGLARVEGNARLVVSELATNAVVHAHTPFVVHLIGNESRLQLVVTDGAPFLPNPTLVPPVWETRGRGLYIVDSYTDDWGVISVDGGKKVWASFTL